MVSFKGILKRFIPKTWLSTSKIKMESSVAFSPKFAEARALVSYCSRRVMTGNPSSHGDRTLDPLLELYKLACWNKCLRQTTLYGLFKSVHNLSERGKKDSCMCLGFPTLPQGDFPLVFQAHPHTQHLFAKPVRMA